MITHYSVLGVHKGSTTEQIRVAYIALAQGAHPDHGGNRHDFAVISEAYRVLRDNAQRSVYDLELELRTDAHHVCNGAGYMEIVQGFKGVVGITRCDSCGGSGRVERER